MREWTERAVGLCEASEASNNPTEKSGTRRIFRVVSVETMDHPFLLSTNINGILAQAATRNTLGQSRFLQTREISGKRVSGKSYQKSIYPVDGGMSFFVLKRKWEVVFDLMDHSCFPSRKKLLLRLLGVLAEDSFSFQPL